MRAKALFVLSLALAAASGAGAADLRVERMELLTHGSVDEDTGDFEASSRLYFDLAIAGGDKFGGVLKLDFLSGDIESDLAADEDLAATATLPEAIAKLNSLTSPRFRTAAITAKSVFELPVDFSYFIGYMDAFASGDDFVPLFGAAPFATSLRGPMVYPEGVGGDQNRFYDGIHAVNGTGFRVGTSPALWEDFVGYAYFYQDSDLGTGRWSGDLRGLFNAPDVKLELFAGASTAADYGVYRGGILFFAAPGEVGEFFLQVGIPYWDPSSALSVDNLYFLFEPRINFGFGAVALTVFYHPGWYRQRATTETSALDAAFNLRFGKIAQDGAQGGIESLFEFRPLTDEPLAVDASPYYSVIAGGIEWDFKLSLRAFPFPSPWYGMLKPFIGLKTSF